VNKCEIVEMRTVSRQYLTVLRRRRRRRLSDGDDASESKWKEGRKEGTRCTRGGALIGEDSCEEEVLTSARNGVREVMSEKK
jgi:hypothetical protein